jgi:hypothetical protein
LREENGASPGGIGGAAGPELGDVNGDGNSPVNADVPYVSQSENTDNLRNYWLHDLDATLGWRHQHNFRPGDRTFWTRGILRKVEEGENCTAT